jgi:hypothetical protein
VAAAFNQEVLGIKGSGKQKINIQEKNCFVGFCFLGLF